MGVVLSQFVQHLTGPAGAAQRTNEKNEKRLCERKNPAVPERRWMNHRAEGASSEAKAKSVLSDHALNCAKSVECCFSFFLLLRVWEREKYG